MAGLAELLLGKSNPFSQFISENQNKVHAAFGGLGSGTNFNEGLSRAAQGAALASPLDQAAAEKRQLANDSITARNKTAAYLRSQPGGAQFADAIENGMIDGSTAFKSWLDASKGQAPQNPYMSAGDGQFFNWQTGEYVNNPNAPAGMDSPPLGTTIYTGRDAAGNIVPMQAGQGKFVPTTMPDGISFDPGGMAGAKTTATVDAKTAAAARAALPGAELSNVNTAKAIAEVRNNAKGMSEWFGQIGPRGVYINPGSEMGQFWAAAEPTNNQAFMQAREALKGGGQITDFEGRKAEDAFSRMRASLEKGDQDQYLRALVDFEEAVALGYQKLKETAQGGYAVPAPAAGGGGGAGGNVTSTGVPWSLE